MNADSDAHPGGPSGEADRRTLEQLFSGQMFRYLKLFDLMSEGVLVYRSDSTILYVNEALCGRFGFSPEDITGKRILDLASPENHPLVERIMANRLSGATERTEIEIPAPEGGTVSLVETGLPIYDGDGKVFAAVSFYVDLSRQREIEREVRALKSFNESIVENIPSSIIVLGADLRIIFANRTFREFTGLGRSEIIGEKVSDILPFRLLREKNILRQVLDVSESGGLRVIDGVRFSLAGRENVVQVRIRKLPEEEARGGRIIIILDDVTAVTSLQQQLAQAQRMDSLGRLAGGVAHDFNNLLGGIMGYASLLLASAEKGSEAEQQIVMIMRSAERAASLTRQLLSLASGKGTEPRVFDPVRVVREVVGLLSRTIDRSITLESSIDPKTPRVLGDETSFQQALLNICLNARDAMPQGGKLSIETGVIVLADAFCMEHLDARPGENVAIRITDTGTGIEPDVLERIFEPFFTTKPKGKGAGLGLSLVYGTVRSMGGFVDVESAPRKGSSFTIYLPPRYEEADAPRESGAEIVPGGTETVLVVEDEEIMRNLSEKILSGAGYRPLPAPDGRRAIEMLSKSPDSVDLVVLDLMMPGLSGAETFSELRSLNPAIPILISTGYAPSGEAEELLRHERTYLLRKPFYMNEMLRKVREILDRSGPTAR